MPWAPKAFMAIPKRSIDTVRGNANARGYGHRWRKARLAFIRHNPLCVGYDERGNHVASCNGFAREVDHLIPVDGPNDPRFWMDELWRARSKPCHSRKTMMELNGQNGIGVDKFFSVLT